MPKRMERRNKKQKKKETKENDNTNNKKILYYISLATLVVLTSMQIRISTSIDSGNFDNIDNILFTPEVLHSNNNSSHHHPQNKNESSRTKDSSKDEEQHQAIRMSKYVNTYNYQPPKTSFKGPAVECGESPSFDNFFGLNHNQRSRFNEDKTIYNRFFRKYYNNAKTTTSNNRNNDKNNVFTYVELGAFDGRTESNTRFFDICLGWKGLLIEGNPRKYGKLLRNRPQAHSISYAPSCSTDNVTIPFAVSLFTNAGLEGFANGYEGRQTVNVPCGPLTPVLMDIFNNNDENENDEEGQQKQPIINFFSLDVEGSEKLVLDTIDFNKVHIDIMMIEVENEYCKKNLPCKVRDEVRQKMDEVGYQRYTKRVQKSDIYIHPKSPYQLS